MKVDEAESRLIKILENHGFDLENPNLDIAWIAFKEFVAESVECQDDGILFQIGCYNFSGEILCYFDFVRQFSITNEDDEYDHMEQLYLQFTCDPTPELMALETNLWAYDFQSLNDYFIQVESLPEFQKGLEHNPWKFDIYQEMV